jgi:hypothetical protein
MTYLLNPYQFATGGGGHTPDYTGNFTFIEGKSGTSGTLSGFSFGPTDATRVLIAAVCHSGSSSQISGVTIGGNAATRAIRYQLPAGDPCPHIWYVSLASGTTGDVVINLSSGTPTAYYCGLYWARNTLSAAGGNSTVNSGAGATVPTISGSRTVFMFSASTALTETVGNLSVKTNATAGGQHFLSGQIDGVSSTTVSYDVDAGSQIHGVTHRWDF